MPGDSVFTRYFEGMDNPFFLLVIGMLVIAAYVAIRLIPSNEKVKLKQIETNASIQLKRLEHDKEREERKADEFQQEMARDRARTEVIGKQNEILENLTRTVDGQSIQMSALIASLEESKLRSRSMGDTIKDTNSKVSEIHTMIVKANK